MKIAFNCNSVILWERISCYKYNLKNIVASELQLRITVFNPYLNVNSVIMLDSEQEAGLTLPSDGIFTLTVEVLNGSLVVASYKDFLYEFCSLQLCYSKLLLNVYSECNTVLKDPCKKDCKESELILDENTKKKSREALEELKSMLLLLFTSVGLYRESYSFLRIDEMTLLPSTLTSVSDMIQKTYDKINMFTKSCGFTCEPIEDKCNSCND